MLKFRAMKYTPAIWPVFIKEVEVENKESLQGQSDTKKLKAEIQKEAVQSGEKRVRLDKNNALTIILG